MALLEKVDTCYISVGCNLVPHALDWGNNNLICFAACNSVAIYDPRFGGDVGSIRQTRAGHSARVNCVRWIKPVVTDSADKEVELISCSSDKTAIIWEIKDTVVLNPVCKLEGHEDAVTAADALHLEKEGKTVTLVATASADNTIKLWIYTEKQIECRQTINLKSEFALDIKLSIHPNSSVPLLIYGGSDTKLHILSMSNDDFVPVLALTGHEDWIRAVDIISEQSGQLLIASSAQDCLIKLWRLSCGCDDSEMLADDISLKVNSYNIKTTDGKEYAYNVSLEANLAGHDNWIYGLHWDRSNKKGDCPRLLSASMDKTMIVWELDHCLGIWIEKVRVGEVGGNTLGFYGSRFSPDGNMIIAHGFQGAFHLWAFNQEVNHWEPQSTVGGHFKEVVDFDWDPLGEFIISVSLDQTTRLHFPWSKNRSQITWHEMARPQIHGYDMFCVAMIDRYTFASGADEKLVRAFKAPKNFIDNFYNLTGKEMLQLNQTNDSLPEGASIPSLGLSNKAIYDKTSKCDLEAKHPKDIYQDAYFVSTSLNRPPTEETLLQNTLWPEVHKLYGHGNEIFSVAANRTGTLLASSCKATKAEHARIILWDAGTWKEVGRLSGHALTVTQMEFSPCGTMLLSVSRDRTWCIFKLHYTDQGLETSKMAYSDKKTGVHSRIIWSCSWCPNGKYFVTGSRDKKAVIWGINDSTENTPGLANCGVHSSLEFEDSVTAVAFAPTMLSCDKSLLAVGLENGTIHLKIINHLEKHWIHYVTLSNLHFHHLAIKRLRFRPTIGKVGSETDHLNVMQLASCGEDHILRVYNVQPPSPHC